MISKVHKEEYKNKEGTIQRYIYNYIVHDASSNWKTRSYNFASCLAACTTKNDAAAA